VALSLSWLNYTGQPQVALVQDVSPCPPVLKSCRSDDPFFAGQPNLNAVTWNPADKGPDATLSADNLTWSAGPGANSYRNVRATQAGSGKIYFEVHYDAANWHAAVGLADLSATLSDYLGSDVHAFGYFNSGAVLGVGGYGFASYTAGDVIGVALDVTAGKAWFAKNNAWQEGDPAAGTGGISTAFTYPIVSIDGTGDSVTGRFSAASQSYAPPTGFSPMEAVSGTTVQADGSAAGAGAAFGDAIAVAQASGSAAGIGAAAATGRALASASGTGAGSAASSASGVAIAIATGTATGSGEQGPELILDGNGDSVANWTAGFNSTVTSTGGRVRVATPGSSYAYQTFTTVAGRTYRLRFSSFYVSGSAAPQVLVGSGGENTLDLYVGATSPGTVDATFIASSASTTISLTSGGAPGTVEFDDISVREAVSAQAVAIVRSSGQSGGIGAASGAATALARSSGTASGTGTGAGAGQADARSSGSAAGIGAAAGTGQALATASGAGSGTGAGAGQGIAINRSAGAGGGNGAAQGNGVAVSQSSGNAAGTGQSAGATSGETVRQAAGDAAGTGAATATTATTIQASGTASGSGSAGAAGVAVASQTGSASGAGNAAGQSVAIVAASGNASATGAGSASGSALTNAAGSASGSGQGSATTTGTFPGSGNATAQGGGDAAGIITVSASGTASGFGSTNVIDARAIFATAGNAGGSGNAAGVATAKAEASGAAAGDGSANAGSATSSAATGNAGGVGIAAGSVIELSVALPTKDTFGRAANDSFDAARKTGTFSGPRAATFKSWRRG
jgi:hypothetical protein